MIKVLHVQSVIRIIFNSEEPQACYFLLAVAKFYDYNVKSVSEQLIYVLLLLNNTLASQQHTLKNCSIKVIFVRK